MVDTIAAAALGKAQTALLGLTQVARFDGWSLVSNRTIRPTATSTTTATARSRGNRLAFYMPFAASAIRLLYENADLGANAPLAPNNNAVSWKAAIEPTNVAVASASGSNVTPATSNSRVPVLFGGKRKAWVDPGNLVLSDPVGHTFKPGTVQFIDSLCAVTTSVAPAAPTLATSTSGGSIAAGTWAVGCTLVFADGSESPCSAVTTQVTTGSTSTITVTAPAAATYPGAVGYRIWVGLMGTVTPRFDVGTDVIDMGQNVTFGVTPVQTSGSQPLRRVLPAGALTMPVGGAALGGTASGAANNGEVTVAGISGVRPDMTMGGVAASAGLNIGSSIGPLAVLAKHPTGKIYPSMTIAGDSINAGNGDALIVLLEGGALLRCALNHHNVRSYTPTVAPLCGHIRTAVPGQTLVFATGHSAPYLLARGLFGTHYYTNLVTNDMSTGTYSATCIKLKIDEGLLVTPKGVQFRPMTMYPRTGSTDGWQTATNQFSPPPGLSAQMTGGRLQYNNVLRSSLASRTITGEAMFCNAANVTPTSNNYVGNGTATIFTTAFPFVQGTESITVGGVAKVVTTDYTYTDTATIAGVNYASGVVFGSAPGNGVVAVATYFAMAGFTQIYATAETYAGFITSGAVAVVDGARYVEADATGAVTLGGIWWALPAGAAIASGTVGAGGSTSTIVTSGLTQDQYRNYAVVITADPVTPTAVGQVSTVTGNTTTTISFSSMAVQPSSSATYAIARVLSVDGAHPSPDGHMQIATGIKPQIDADMAVP